MFDSIKCVAIIILLEVECIFGNSGSELSV